MAEDLDGIDPNSSRIICDGSQNLAEGEAYPLLMRHQGRII
jgi:hypothetical protein